MMEQIRRGRSVAKQTSISANWLRRPRQLLALRGQKPPDRLVLLRRREL
jgi:hypothetical protein